jgi:small GTP-binding protein
VRAADDDASRCAGVPGAPTTTCAGVDFMEKTIELDEYGEAVRLMIWDTAGQEEFDSLTSRYYKGAGAAVLVFSTEDRDSFDALESWKRKVEDECGPIPMALVQNKIDLIRNARMTKYGASWHASIACVFCATPYPTMWIRCLNSWREQIAFMIVCPCPYPCVVSACRAVSVRVSERRTRHATCCVLASLISLCL